VRATLAQVPALAGLSQEWFERCANAALYRRLRDRQVVLDRGDPALGMFIVQDGAIELSMLGRSGNRYLCGMFTPGQTFGLIPSIDGGKTALTSSARGASTLLLIPRDIVVEAVSNNGPIAAALLITVARRARFLIDLIGNQITLPLDGRVANMLLVATQFQSQDAALGDPMELGFSQTDLADIAGISRQSLGPILKSLEAAGIIALGYRSIRVLKPADLQARIEKSAR
jgi:CRP/FNR family transcriptional regulator, cyclic AMP receptor protein